MAVFTDSTRLPIGQATALTEAELLALFDRGAGIDRLIERLIDIKDAADAPTEDLEDGHEAELDCEGEATLGAPEQHHNQAKWAKGLNDADGELELSLGAPERHPLPCDGFFQDYYVERGGDASQTSWSAGSRNPGTDEGESEPGYDLPCGSEHDGLEPENEGDELDVAEGPDDNRIADRDGADEQWLLVGGGPFV